MFGSTGAVQRATWPDDRNQQTFGTSKCTCMHTSKGSWVLSLAIYVSGGRLWLFTWEISSASAWTLPSRPLKVGLLSSPTITTSRQHLPSCGCHTPISALLSNKADFISSKLRCQLFAVHTNPLGSVRITEEDGFQGSGQNNILKIKYPIFLRKSFLDDVLKDICLCPLVPSQILPAWKSMSLFHSI